MLELVVTEDRTLWKHSRLVERLGSMTSVQAMALGTDEGGACHVSKHSSWASATPFLKECCPCPSTPSPDNERQMIVPNCT
jgi:hypothetical protein